MYAMCRNIFISLSLSLFGQLKSRLLILVTMTCEEMGGDHLVVQTTYDDKSTSTSSNKKSKLFYIFGILDSQ